MESCKCTCFSHPEVLRAVSLKWLSRLLEPYAAYLESRGLELPGPDADWDELDDRKLLSVLTTPDPEMPRDLLDALYYLCEMATPEAMDCLLDEAESRGIPIDDDPEPTPHDIAVQVWLHDSDVVKHHHAERSVGRPYSFVYFQGPEESGAGLWTPEPHAIHALESDLAEWFGKRKRGPHCVVQCYLRDDCIRFIVGHGGAARRESCVCGGRHSKVLYRPERHDLVLYRPSTGELQVHAGTEAETKAYGKFFGRHLFASDRHFSRALKYTLEPLKADGEKALVCSDVDGVDSIRLTSIQYELGGPRGAAESLRANDVLALMNERHEAIPEEARITEAGFEVDFSGSRTPRTVFVDPSDSDGYERASDSDRAGDWLKKRGFAFFCQLFFLPVAQLLLESLQECEWVSSGLA